MLCGDDDQLAVIDIDEKTLWSPQQYTWEQLRELVAAYASGLCAAGLKKGDVVTCMYFLISDLLGGTGGTGRALILRSDRRQSCPVSRTAPRYCCCRRYLFLLCYGYWRESTTSPQG